MDIFNARTYREVVEMTLKAGEKSRPRGVVQKLAKYLNCHSTLISQILHEKADFSIDQGILFCEFAHFRPDEIDHFVDLLFLERAGQPISKHHFNQRIQNRVKSRESFGERVKAEGKIDEKYDSIHYRTWLPQAVHVFCQIGDGATILEISKALKVDLLEIKETVKDLVRIGIIKQKNNNYISTVDYIHAKKSSKFIKQIHINWRLRTIQNIQSTYNGDTHFSCAMSLSKNSVEKIKQSIFDHIESISNEVKNSKPEELYSFCMDFYPLVRNGE